MNGASEELASLKGYFRVNDYMQSTSHPNVFAAGDCVSMDSYESFPPKAGVYAVRAGPIVSTNIVNFINKVELQKYVPQSGFLSLLMTADGKAIGQKFGIAFTGKWVWQMKDYIDVGFMKLFDKQYLFKDSETMENRDEKGEILEKEKAPVVAKVAEIRAKVAEMSPENGANSLLQGEEEEEFHE